MITEVVDINVRPEDMPAFGKALAQAVATILSKSKGFRGHRIMASQESPGRVLLLVEWDTVEDHMVGFRQSPAYAQWRALIGHFFAQPPRVEHFDPLG